MLFQQAKESMLDIFLRFQLFLAERLLGTYTNDGKGKRGKHKEEKKKFKKPSYTVS